jgi:hypothetical protein
MTAIVKKKLCWNCEGRVSSQEENCPFCGVYINGTLNIHGGDDEDEEEEVEEEPLDENRAHVPLYTPEAEGSSPPQPQEAPEPAVSTPFSLTQYNTEFLSLFCLTSGAVLFLFSMVLVLFADNGALTLQWDASLWFVYLIVSLPALFFGWRFLQKP